VGEAQQAVCNVDLLGRFDQGLDSFRFPCSREVDKASGADTFVLEGGLERCGGEVEPRSMSWKEARLMANPGGRNEGLSHRRSRRLPWRAPAPFGGPGGAKSPYCRRLILLSHWNNQLTDSIHRLK
jgi:hypothetical protein